MPDLPNTRFINLVDAPAPIEYSKFGECVVPLDSGDGIIDVTPFRRATILIGSSTASSCVLAVGKIHGATLAMAYVFPLDNQAHTVEIIGPEMNLVLQGGPPLSKENVQVWVYLRS